MQPCILSLSSLLLLAASCWGWSLPPTSSSSQGVSRREAFGQAVSSAALIAAASESFPVSAAEGKKTGISNDELGKIIEKDVAENQFMVRADLTRSIYDESATFTDEIDTYQLDQWIKGTKRLFVADKSHVDMVPGSLQVSNEEASFLFTEYLTFNIPVLKPKVDLSGKVILKRDPSTGLITSYQEKWDQDVNTVLKSAKLFGN
eukprot:CAMPEP_0176003094 /NCGR_PEP_ID=MMETSP0120_2-20121206/992_1 /TAXON_ID=160619 /ORGANISM="Kryptoperidinium foliaceum, Strain CCMP 1326" /LENGTH=203 /DNA_ID=CAMNT_0017335717 /DNA_START=1 /DNA_END=612 /DNA_ORIENTATION=-